jgi:hypothetical protein
VQSVSEIAVDVPGRTKHGFVPVRLATVGMRAGVSLTGIRLNLGNPEGDRAVRVGALQDAAEYRRGDLEHVTGEEAATRGT